MTFLDMVRLAHVPPILHIQADYCLPRRPHVHIFRIPYDRPRLPSVLLCLFRSPRLDPRLAVFDEEAEVKDILHRLREGLWVEKTINSIHLRILVDKLLLLFLDLTFIVDLLRYLGFVFLCPRHGRLLLLFRPFSQRVLYDVDMFLNRAQFVTITLFLLSSLIHVFRVFLFFIRALLLFLRLALASLRLFTFLGRILCIEGSIKERNMARHSVEAHAYLKAESTPVELGGRAGADGALLDECLCQAYWVIAGNLNYLLRLPRGLIRNQVDILRIQHRLAGVTHVLPQGVVPIAEAVQLVAVVAFAAAGGVGVSGAHGNLALEIALPTAQDATVPLGLPRDAHDLELLLLRLPSVPAAGRPAVLLVVRVVFVFLLFGRAILAVLVLDVFLVVILGGVASLLRHGGMHCLD
mmetsp:Transcript_35133/g.74940  ORF Transcript_35133/g.74940 Transcript_35133/m.74940 type:complete len:409 (+) Transcript_35133:554-1780(+)